MDWWRAKLVLIAAFLCLDVLLAWQAHRMQVPAAPALLLRGVPQGATTAPLPVLQVEWQDFQPGDAQLVPGSSCWSQNATQYELCTAPGSHADVEWFSPPGFLLYTSAQGVPARRGNGAALSAARAIVARVNPDEPAALWTEVGTDAATDTREFSALDFYEGWPLFNGQWLVRVGPRQILALRLWLKVEKQVGDPEPLISPRQAVADAGRVYTTAAVSAGGAPQLGYYSLRPGSPDQPWDVYPVYRIRLPNQHCIFVDAAEVSTGAPGEGGTFEQPCEPPFDQGSG